MHGKKLAKTPCAFPKNTYLCSRINHTTSIMESRNVIKTEYKKVGEAAARMLERLQQRKKDNLAELSLKMDYYFGAE